MVSRTYDGKYEAWLVGCTGYRDQFGWFYDTAFKYWLVDPATGAPIRIDSSPNTNVTVGIWQPHGGSINSGTEPKGQAQPEHSNPN